MNTQDRRSLGDDEKLVHGNRSAKAPGIPPTNLERSIRDLQATAGNRTVSDLMGGSLPTLQGSFFGGRFGGLEDWLAKESSGATPGFDPSTKAEAGEPSMKEAPSDNSMKLADASDKWGGSPAFEAAGKWDSSEKLDASNKWDPSEKLDGSNKWDASAKAEPDLASKEDELGSQFTELEEF